MEDTWVLKPINPRNLLNYYIQVKMQIRGHPTRTNEKILMLTSLLNFPNKSSQKHTAWRLSIQVPHKHDPNKADMVIADNLK